MWCLANHQFGKLSKEEFVEQSPSHTDVQGQSPGPLGKVMSLPDGRNLEYHECGDLRGCPVVYLHGSPGSGASVAFGGFEDRLGRELGVRWIAPDRPGIGASTFYSNRRILDYTADIAALAEHLQLDEYCILATGSGASYALACAKHLPRTQLLAVGIFAGCGPWEAGPEGQSDNYRMMTQGWKDSPHVMTLAIESIYGPVARASDYDALKEVWRQDLGRWFSAEDRVYLENDASMYAAARMFRQVFMNGMEAYAEEMRLSTEAWGFDIATVGYEGILLWYSGADERTPPQVGRYLAERLPNPTYKELPDVSHFGTWTEDMARVYLKALLMQKSDARERCV